MADWRSVLHVIAGISRGGAENHLVELVQGQRARGWDVNVAYLHGDGHWTDHLQGLGVGVHALGMRRYGDPAPVFALHKVLRRTRPQVVHAHLPGGELYARLALLAARGIRPTFIISKHNDEPLYNGPGWRVLARWIARRASRLI